jgi:hypothetical protein
MTIEPYSTGHCISFSENLMNILVQIANKMGLQKKYFSKVAADAT